MVGREEEEEEDARSFSFFCREIRVIPLAGGLNLQVWGGERGGFIQIQSSERDGC